VKKNPEVKEVLYTNVYMIYMQLLKNVFT